MNKMVFQNGHKLIFILHPSGMWDKSQLEMVYSAIITGHNQEDRVEKDRSRISGLPEGRYHIVARQRIGPQSEYERVRFKDGLHYPSYVSEFVVWNTEYAREINKSIGDVFEEEVTECPLP